MGLPPPGNEREKTMEFFAYEHIKELVVYSAFGWIAGTCIYGYGYILVSGVRWAVAKLKKRFGKNLSEEENGNE